MKKLLRHAAICVLFAWSGLASAATVPLGDLARHIQYDNVKISSNGRYLAATAVVKGQPMLALVDLTKGTGAMMKPRDGNQVIGLYWANDHRVLYTEGTKVAGFDRPVPTGEIFAVNGDGTGSALLFGYRAGGPARSTHLKQRESERASARIIDTLRDDENHVLIGVASWDGSVEGDFIEVYALDVRDGSKRKITTAPLRNAEFLTDHHGVARFAVGVDSHAYGQVYYREGEGKPWNLLFQGTPEKEVPTPLAFSRDDSRVYMACEAPGKTGALCPWDVSAQAMQPPVWSNESADIMGLVRSLDRQDIVGVYSMPGTPKAEAIVPGSDAMKVIAELSRALPGQSIEVVSSTDDGSKAVALASSDLEPGTFYLWDTATGKASQLLQRAPWIKPDQMATKRPVELKARDGMIVHGYLSMPPGKEEAKHLPLVVYVHGGPFGVRDDWDFDPYVQMMATRGYAVLQVNYRGSGGYGSAF